MKVIMIMFDTLNRRMLPPYGCDWIHAPNFKRLADQTVIFDNCYVGSMPCVPARRELHTGRYNFLHRGWGPLEPFDDSMPEILNRNGVYSHLITDHQHYWEDGGATYHQRYNSFEFVRGQEGDPWKGKVKSINATDPLSQVHPAVRQDQINRSYIKNEQDFPQAKVFQLASEFLLDNDQEDNWFLQIETFDPHEPFFAPQKYKDLYPHEHADNLLDWPRYGEVTEGKKEVEHLRLEYAALLSMCDNYLGKILDLMDDLDLWKDTMLIVNTDHGFLLGEHDQWAKCVQPFYNEVAHTPLFIWDPSSKKKGEHRKSLVQMIDMAPTLLELFDITKPKDMQGFSLQKVIDSDVPVREAALFGIHGGHINCTDGHYVYMRAPVTEANEPLYAYTLMPTHMRAFFSIDEMGSMELSKPFTFTKGLRPLKTKGNWQQKPKSMETLLFDLKADPQQMEPLNNSTIEKYMLEHLKYLMEENDAPSEQYQRIGIEAKK
ncbi:sulfatase [Bacillus sp. J14TS2]|nr:sulfatase [Bacillus sp. J14TS2]